MPIAIGGTVVVRVNGRSIAVMADVKHSFTDESRELARGVDGHTRVKFIPEVPFVEFKASDISDVDTEELAAAENVTVTLEKRNQKLGTLVAAYQVNQVETDDIDASFVLRFEGTEKAHETLG